jgi:MarR family transcriptional regulator for hemolysin
MQTLDSETFGFTITATARMVRTLFEKRIIAAGLGITPAEARALIHIAARPGIRLNRLAVSLGVEPMTACGVVDRLEQRGLVERMPDPDDRRAKNLIVTDAADALMTSVAAAAADLREDALAGLSAAERETMMSALRTVRDNLEILLAPEAPELVTS